MKKYFLIFFTMLFTLASCSNLGNSNKGSLTFSISGETLEKIMNAAAERKNETADSRRSLKRDDTGSQTDTDITIEETESGEPAQEQEDKLTFTLSVKGEFNDSASKDFTWNDVELLQGKVTELTIDDVPAGVEVYVQVDISSKIDGEENVIITGKSETIKVIQGDNFVDVKLEWVGGPDQPVIPEPDPQNIASIFVSSKGNDETGDGTVLKPFASITKANDLITNEECIYTIIIEGTIKGAQKIESNKAKSIIITRIPAASAVLDGGFTEKNKGTTLTISTEAPVAIEGVEITGGYANDFGGGISIAEGAHVCLSASTVIHDNYACGEFSGEGAGVYNKGELTIDGATITKNHSIYHGAGVKNEYPGLLYMNSGTITYNECTGEDQGFSGGILNDGSFFMKGGEISHNKAVNGAGGIYNQTKEINGLRTGGKFFMYGGTISENEGNSGGISNSWNAYAEISGGTITKNIANCNGGGICNENGSSIRISGDVVISENIAIYGAGIYSEGADRDIESSLSISGGQITTNHANSEGKGIYIGSGTFELSGDTVISSSDEINDVYLKTGAVVTVKGKLSETAPVITIHPENYKDDIALIALGSGVTDTTLSEALAHFALPEDASSWEITEAGKLKAISGEASFYVKADGNDETGDGSEEKPFASITKAVRSMTNNALDYRIFVTGVLTDLQKIENPDENSVVSAKSITIRGTSEKDDNGNPVDGINRGQANSQNGVTNGHCLEISTSVPVTITNLLITGGYGSSTKAAGITIAQGATVSLGDGVLVYYNRAGSNSRGGAVRNEGTLYMYGSATIGDKTKTAHPLDSSTDYNFKNTSNWAGCGGGIYNGSSTDDSVCAKAYLGYKRSESGEPEKTELTGGIFYSSGVGGAIYNTKASYVYFDSGSLNWNGTEGGGGAVHNAGHFIMTGGEMMYNRALGTNEAYGGAFYNDSSASVFEMAGGTINNNIAYRFYSYGDKSYGGAIYNSGKVYMYGSAVIGDASKVENASYDENNDTAAPSENWGNKAMHGGAICSASKAEVYLGYKPDSNGEAVEEELTGGIYYNYAALNLKYPDDRDGIGGGAIETASGGIVKIASGTIAYNTSEGCGGAVYMSSSYGEVTITGGTIENNIAAVSGGAVYMGSGKSSVLKLSGDAYIPSNDGKNDIFMGGSTDSYYSSISLIGPLSNDFAVRITPGYYSEKVALITAASDSGTTVDAEYKKFTLTQPENGAWAIGENGTLVDKAAHPSNFSVTIQSIESSQPFLISSAGTIITAPEEYLMYTWTILSDTETKTVLSSQSNVFDAAEYFTEGGMYEVLVTAKISEAEGDETSATVSILITSTAN